MVAGRTQVVAGIPRSNERTQAVVAVLVAGMVQVAGIAPPVFQVRNPDPRAGKSQVVPGSNGPSR